MAGKYYLAGKMTGLPNYGYDAFAEVAAKLRGAGFEIASPHEIDYDETQYPRGTRPYKDYMKGGLDLLFECDGIILMDGWSTSVGARIELSIAEACGYDIKHWPKDFVGNEDIRDA